MGDSIFVCARAADRARLMEHFDARVAGKKSKSPLPTRRFQKCGSFGTDRRSIWTTNFGGQEKDQEVGRRIKITVKPSALIILQPAATIKK